MATTLQDFPTFATLEATHFSSHPRRFTRSWTAFNASRYGMVSMSPFVRAIYDFLASWTPRDRGSVGK